jgi:hypothetical protein
VTAPSTSSVASRAFWRRADDTCDAQVTRRGGAYREARRTTAWVCGRCDAAVEPADEFHDLAAPFEDDRLRLAR